MKRIFIASGLLLVAFLAVAQTPPTLNDQYGKKLGNLLFTKSTLSLGHIKNNEVRLDSIRMFNSGSTAITVSYQNKMQFLKVEPSQLAVEPGKEGLLVVSYDASKKNDFGFVLDRISLSTNDALMPTKTVNVTATIDEYFPLTGDSLQPKARFNETLFNYGELRAGEKASHDFSLYNDGQKTLKIHKAKSTCGCIKVTVLKSEIEPGQSGTIRIEFDSFGKEGKDSRSISIFVNDPLMPELRLEMAGNVIK